MKQPVPRGAEERPLLYEAVSQLRYFQNIWRDGPACAPFSRERAKDVLNHARTVMSRLASLRLKDAPFRS